MLHTAHKIALYGLIKTSRNPACFKPKSHPQYVDIYQRMVADFKRLESGLTRYNSNFLTWQIMCS